MRKEYTLAEGDTKEWIERAVIDGIKKGTLKDYIAGIDSSCRIQESATFVKSLSDIFILIRGGLYPVYVKYNLGGKKQIQEALEEMTASGNPYELFQVYEYVSEESRLRDDYYNLPFIVVEKTLIYKVKKKRREMEAELKETIIEGHYNAWVLTENIEKSCDEFIDPESCFCDEYNRGGKKGYIQKSMDGEGTKELIVDALKSGNLLNVMLGKEKKYRIFASDSGIKELTDMEELIENGLFPLYENGHTELKCLVSDNLEKMVTSLDPISLYQAYEYIGEETILLSKYCNLPYVVANKELIEKMKKTRLELAESLKRTPIRKSSAWDITGNIEKNYDAFSNTEEFFKENF